MKREKPDHELFDISDVQYDFAKSKSIREIHLIMSSSSAFNLMKFYLALKDYVEKIEDRLGVSEEPDQLQ